MKLTFYNIGAVQEATVDLSKKLNIFCGPNNTGKTYIAFCIYGISKLNNRLRNNSKILPKEKLQELSESGKISINLIEFFKNHKSLIKSTLESNFINILPNTFGISREASEKIFPDTTIKVEIHNDNKVIESLRKQDSKSKMGFGSDLTFDIVKKAGQEDLEIIMIVKGKEPRDLTNGFYSRILTDRIFETIFRSLIPNTYISPVERNSIYTFSKELSLQRNILVDKILQLKEEKSERDDPFDFIERRATRYPLPIRDGLEISEDLSNFKKQDSSFSSFANELENTVLNGKILLSKEGEVLFASNHAKGIKLPIHLTASIVKSLSSLVLYFRHLAKEGDFIIIDEPELNLHPDSQIIISRIIAQIVNKGFKVLVNTHSDYIIRELNNLVMLSKLQDDFEEIAKEYGYIKEHILNSNDVGAYLFDYNKKKKVVSKQLEVTEDGFEVETIDKVINDLNGRSQHLYFNLKNHDSQSEELN
ncbi:MAG: AAA family ATPase [Bacteroidia bacterium]